MTTTITVECQSLGGSTPPTFPMGAVDKMEGVIAAVPLDFTLLSLYGLILVSDVTTSTSRTFQLRWTPSSVATATCALDDEGRITSTTVTAAGAQYPAQPVVGFSGAGWQPPYPNGVDNVPYPAAAQAVCMIGSGDVVLLSGGGSYSSSPTVKLLGGGLAPGGTPVGLTPTIVGGVITGFSVTQGGPYVQPPQVVITDTTGSGAEASLGVHISAIKVGAPGRGYKTAPAISITPLFLSLVTSGSAAQIAAFDGWMLQPLQQATNMPWTQTISIS